MNSDDSGIRKRETRFELATTCLEGRDSTVELLPQVVGEVFPRRILHTDEHIIKERCCVVKPPVGFEPTTYALQKRCSTTEL